VSSGTLNLNLSTELRLKEPVPEEEYVHIITLHTDVKMNDVNVCTFYDYQDLLDDNTDKSFFL